MKDLRRYESPVQGPQSVAWDDTHLWIVSCITMGLYKVDASTLTVLEEFTPPYEIIGITWTGSEFRTVTGNGSEELETDYRSIHSFRPDTGFSEQGVPCPDRSGSFLAFDGSSLYLSQAWDKKLIELNDDGSVRGAFDLSRRPVGMTFAGGWLYMATVNDDWVDTHVERLDLRGQTPQTELLGTLPFKARGVAFDGKRFWIGDRDNHGLVSFG